MRFWLALLWILLPVAGFAQQSDKDFLTSYLQNTLSGAGRDVAITGFAGALSSQATMAQMTIADDAGIWLTLKDVTLDWDRAALLNGQIIVNTFAVDEIDLERIPSSGQSATPAAEAKGFALPDLPVSVLLNGIEARHIKLGPAVLGQAVEGTVTASVILAGGQGSANVQLKRNDDGPAGAFSLITGYSQATGILSVALTAKEAAGGIAVGLLGVPGAPSADLIIAGTGPVSDFKAKVVLSTDGVTRLAGDVTLTGDAAGQAFAVDLAGDPTPVFLPRYAAFFGPALHLQAKGTRFADGRMALSQLAVQAQALKLDGSVSLDAQGLPEAFALTGTLGLASGSVVLPMAGARETRLDHADLSLNYDRAKGDGWQGRAVVQGLDHAALKAQKLTLTGDGHIGAAGAAPSFDGKITFAADGLAMTGPGLAQALGDTVQGQTDLVWQASGAGLQVQNLSIAGTGYQIATTGMIGGLAEGITLNGAVQGSYDDLSRLALLAGQPLSGKAQFQVKGTGSLLGGTLDLTGAVSGHDLGTGISQLDGLLRGESKIAVSVLRDETGTTLRALNLAATTLDLSAQGRLTSEGANLTGDVNFRDISVLGAGYHGTVAGKATLVGSLATGTFGLEAVGTDLGLGQDQADRLLAGQSKLSVAVTLDQGVAVIDRVTISNPQLTLDAAGKVTPAGADVTAKLALPDLTVLGSGFGGAVAGTARMTGTLAAGVVGLDLTGTDLSVGQALADRVLRGTSQLTLDVKLAKGEAVIDRAVISNPQVRLEATGTMAVAGSDVTATLSVPNLNVLGAGFGGSVNGTAKVTGTLTQAVANLDLSGIDLTVGQAQANQLLRGVSQVSVGLRIADGVALIDRAVLANPQLKLDATGTVAAAGSDLTATLATDLSGLGGGYRGTLDGQVHFTGTPADGHIVVGAKASNLAVNLTGADALLRGQSSLELDAGLTEKGFAINRASFANPQFNAMATGTVTGAERRLELKANLGNLALLYPQFPGAVTISGLAVQSAAGYRLDIAGKGPAQIDARVTGTLANDFGSGALAISGTATAALVNVLAAPRSLSGPVRFDLRLNGPLRLASLSGPVSISGGSLVDPDQTFSLQGISGQAVLAGGRARVTATAAVSTGGTIDLAGAVGLAAPYSGDLNAMLHAVVLRDPDLYSTVVNGAVTVTGPVLGGALVAGAVNLGRTELRIPATGFGADGGLPGLQHANEPPPSRATRLRAGLLDTAGPGGARGSGGFALNLRISAPNQVFIRGRGLDAELGGSLVLRGTTRAIVPSGSFNLIRGRLDILGKRLVLSEAMLQLQGALVPFLRMVASVDSDGITTSVVIEGPADNPKVTFTSSPQLPQEEVLARLLFDHGLDKLTAFQAIQLATAVATLAGRGGEGVIGTLRSKFGLDNLDVRTDAAGNAELTAGKYLSEKVYTEVTVDQAGTSSISLNLDVASHVTVKGHLSSDGQTGLGIYLQKDY